MSVTNRLMGLCARRGVEDEQKKEEFKKVSRDRLGRILEKKISTSFIGALAQFEAHFGHIWGHGLSEAQCTQEQLASRETWEKCRTEVLTNGNQQKRAVGKEIQQYDITWNRYQTIMKPQTKEENK